MALGDAFPVEFRRQQIEQCLVPGAVLYLEVTFPEVTKNKYLVLVGTADPNLYSFVVNTETHPYIESREHLSVCQVTIDQANHDFLDYDSKIACHEVFPLRRQDVINALLADFSRYKGGITVDVKDEILAAVKHARTISKVQQREIIASLDGQFGG